MLPHERTLSALYKVKEANQKGRHSARFHYIKCLEQVNLWRQTLDYWLPRAGGGLFWWNEWE